MSLLHLDAEGKHAGVQYSGGVGDLFPPQLELRLSCELNFTLKAAIL